MRERAETLLLVLALAAVAAFLASFAAGLRGGGRAARADDPLGAAAAPPSPAGAGGAPAGSAPGPGADSLVRVEVLNAAGRPGLARLATGQLRDAGFDVVYFGNAESRQDSSAVIDRAGRPEAARAVAAALGIARVVSQLEPGLQLEATVLLGLDWRPGWTPGSARRPARMKRARLRGEFLLEGQRLAAN